MKNVLNFENNQATLKSITDVATFIGNSERDDYRVSALFYVTTGNLDVIKSSITKKIISATKQKQVFGNKLFPLLAIRADKDSKNGYKFNIQGSKSVAEFLQARKATDIFNLLGIDADKANGHEGINERGQMTNAYFPRFVELLEAFLNKEAEAVKEAKADAKTKKEQQLEAFKSKSPSLATADDSVVNKAFEATLAKISAYQQLINTLGKKEDDLNELDLSIINDVNELLADLENLVSVESRTPTASNEESTGIVTVNANA